MPGGKRLQEGDDPRQVAMEITERLLARRPHTRAELKLKLRQKGIPGEIADQALNRAVELRWLDESSAVRMWIDSWARRGGHGRNWVRARLQAKGVPGETISGLLTELWDDRLELELARHEARVKSLTLRGGEPLHARRKVAAMLFRRGFDSDVAMRVSREFFGSGWEEE